MSNEKRAPSCLGYIGVYTTQFVGMIIVHYKDPGSLLNRQYFMVQSIQVFFCGAGGWTFFFFPFDNLESPYVGANVLTNFEVLDKWGGQRPCPFNGLVDYPP